MARRPGRSGTGRSARSDATLQAVQRLVPIAQGVGLSLPTLALAWVLRRGEVASAITGASRPGQVHANALASGAELTADVLAAIDAALGTAPVKAPTLAPLAGGRPAPLNPVNYLSLAGRGLPVAYGA